MFNDFATTGAVTGLGGVGDFAANAALGYGAEASGNFLGSMSLTAEQRALYTAHLAKSGPKSFMGKASALISNISPKANSLSYISSRASVGSQAAKVAGSGFGPLRPSNIIASKFSKTAAFFTGRAGAAGAGVAAAEIGGVALRAFGASAGAAFVQDLTKAGMIVAGVADTNDGMLEQMGRQYMSQKSQERTTATMSYGFTDTRAAATMRQRSLRAIHNAQMNINQVFGQEATYAHS